MKYMCVMICFAALIIQGCAGTIIPAGSKDHEILSDLEQKARQVDSYAVDYTVNGMRVKRMYFQFEKDGQPFYRFREDLVRSGKRFIYIFNADGMHDYHYYPDDKKACRCPTAGAWNESNYKNARDRHFGYQDAEIVAEDVIGTNACWLLKMHNNIYAVSKEKGVKLAKNNNLKDKQYAVFFENIEFNLSDDVFGIPGDVRVTDRKACDFQN